MIEDINKEPIIVGIGASAGGLEALQEFVKCLPQITGCAFVIAQHLSPTYKSMMVDLLSRETKRKIVPVEQGISIEKEVIYITPPNHDVTIKDDKLYLKPPLSQIGPKPSIDIFFESLAIEKKEKAIGIILSGTGSDGSHGIRSIKAEGGITMTQTPESAKYDGMVVSAINTGNIDFILPIPEMIQEIENIYQYSIGNFDIKDYEQKKDYLTEIFDILKVEKKVDFSNYKLSTIRRRLSRRMVALKIISFPDYISYLKTNKEEITELYKDLLIGVTYFFRDNESFVELEGYIRNLIKSKLKTRDIRMWSVACSTGEEAYSFAIMLHNILGINVIDYNIQIFATDIDDVALEMARKGRYPEASLQNMPQDFLSKYFTIDGQYYNVIKPIRDMVLFSHHDINQSPPFLRVDMISCRNVMIYFNQTLQEKIFPLFHYSLNDDGILFLGKSETIGRFSTLFATLDKKHKIYKTQIAKNKLKGKFTNYNLQNSAYELPNHKVPNTTYTLEESARDTIVNILLPNSVVINTNHDLLFFQKELFPYLKISPGTATFNIFKMIDEQLNLELRSVVHGAIKDKTSKKSRYVRFATPTEQYFVQIIVAPLLNIPDKELYLISFMEEKEDDIKLLGLINSDEKKVTIETQELEFELKSTKEHLQTVIEELETSNEEMQSLNEELQSANEELQSSNEELETSNEELQSSNEELQTAYSELNHMHGELETKNTQIEKSYITIKKDKDSLEQVTNRFETAIESIKGGIFEYNVNGRKKGYIDVKFAKILGYTKKELLKYEKDIHTFISSSIHDNYIENYTKSYQDFIESKNIFEMIVRIKTKNEEYKFIRIYKKISQSKNGEKKVVGIIVDVTNEYQASLQVKLQKQRLDFIFDSISNIIIVNDGKEIIEVNKAFEKYFNTTVKEFKKEHSCIGELFEEVDDQLYLSFNPKKPKEWLKKLLKDNLDYKVKMVFKNIQYYFSIKISQIDLDEVNKGYVVTLNDITPQVSYQEQLKNEVDKQLLELRQKDEMLISQSKSAAMGEMISAIAHQWRQPLNTLSLYNISLLENKSIDPEELESYVSKSNTLIQRMSSTIDDFRDFFKPNKNKERFTLQNSIQSSLNIIGAQLKAHDISFINTIEEDYNFYGYKAEFEQVLINIINNSKDAILAKHAKEDFTKGFIKIEATLKDEFINISISDNGIGIDESILESIFNPYFTTKFESQGTGLGLYMAQKIIEKNMNGALSCKNLQSGGAEFTISLKWNSDA